MKKVKIYILPKQGVIDPQGSTVKKSLVDLGYGQVNDVRIGKYMEILMDDENIENSINEMATKILINPVMEEYRYEIEEV